MVCVNREEQPSASKMKDESAERLQHEKKEMSLGEKEICLKVLGEQPELPYPMKETLCSDGVSQREYVIPDEARQEVLEKLCFLLPVPALDETMFDLHEQKNFKVGDYRVIRWHGTNILASPYFDRSGGMLVDWLKPEECENGTMVKSIDGKFASRLQP